MEIKSIINRFWDKVLLSSDCWEWQGHTDKDGYGQFMITSNQAFRAHRFSYELLVEKIPQGLTIDHLCKNKSCVNPAHLQPVTLKENIRRSVSFNGSKTHCRNGHEFNKENTYYHTSSTRKYRNCKICRNERRLA